MIDEAFRDIWNVSEDFAYFILHENDHWEVSTLDHFLKFETRLFLPCYPSEMSNIGSVGQDHKIILSLTSSAAEPPATSAIRSTIWARILSSPSRGHTGIENEATARNVLLIYPR